MSEITKSLDEIELIVDALEEKGLIKEAESLKDKFHQLYVLKVKAAKNKWKKISKE